MGIALLAFVDLLMPLQSLASRWMATRRDHDIGGAGLRYVSVRPAVGNPPSGLASSVATKPARPLRVVRVVDRHANESHAGRVVISGRMSDVCAELDRLAALEASGAVSLHDRNYRLH